MQRIIDSIFKLNELLHGFVWGPVMLFFLFATGAYFTVKTGFFQIFHLKLWFNSTFLAIFKNKDVTKSKDPHAISQFQSLSAALAGTIGTGNIVGVATAITMGGAGAVFWMWISALFGMMTKYAENVLSIFYRYKDNTGAWIGGPMIYLERGAKQKWLASLFSLFCIMASFGIGNMSQANSVAHALYDTFAVPSYVTGIILALAGGFVIIGGLKRIAKVAESLVPFMALLYIAGTLFLIFRQIENVPAAFIHIFSQAFSFRAAQGGASGYIISQAIRIGVARGIFTNEAGLGSSSMIHSASNVKEPVKQGMWGIFEVFTDTIVMCTLTALAILTSGGIKTTETGAALVIDVFTKQFGSLGGIFIAVSIVLFAFSTLIGWSYYGERGFSYLFGSKYIKIYKEFFILIIFTGCVSELEFVWSISDTFNGLMAIPNLIGLWILHKKVIELTDSYLKRKAKGWTD